MSSRLVPNPNLPPFRLYLHKGQARMAYNGTYPFWDIYTDCMIAKGYDLD